MKLATMGLSLMFLAGCEYADVGSDDGDFLGAGADSGGADGADASGACDDYRTAYPGGPYGFSQGSIMADPPGMVDAAGTAMSLADIYSDRTKRVLVIANAFDT